GVAWMLLRSISFMTARFLFAAALASLASPAPATVAIVGVEGPLLANVRDFLDDPPCDADRTAVRRYAEELPERLRPALAAFGHYHATVDVAREPDRDDCWQVSVAIDPGDPVVVRSVRLDVSGEADSDPRFATLLENFPLRAGSVLRHGDYLRFKSVVDVLARERGYFDGRFTTERIDVYLDSGTADIELAFDSGPR